MRRVFLAAAVSAFMNYAPIASAAGLQTVGNGVESCRLWTMDKLHDQTQRKMDAQWLAGYLSGIASGTGFNLFSQMTGVQAVLFVDMACAKLPETSVFDVATTLAQIAAKQLVLPTKQAARPAPPGPWRRYSAKPRG